jgi:predicted RND superfamily exporter protein
VITWLIYGRVHGITLSFGSGIIGLAIDYGFHYVFSKDKKMAWKSNLYALLTTLMVFVIFLFSSVPLIQQMMIFSIVGLVASYLFSRLLLVHDHIDVTLNLKIKQSQWHALSIVLALVGIFHLLFFKVDTTPPQIKSAQTWFYSQMKNEKMFFKVYEAKDLNEMEGDAKKTMGSGIRSEGIYSYIPMRAEQAKNAESWIRFKEKKIPFSENESRMFAPFEEGLEKLTLQSRINLQDPPAYLTHLAKSDKVISMWFSKDSTQEAIIKKEVSGVDSLMEIYLQFTSLLTQEISRFIPITLFGIFLLLMFRYLNVKKSLICLVPFAFSLGLYGILYRYFHFPLSFMSLLGLFLIYGLSVDYGIFSTDFFTHENRDHSEESSLNLSLLVNWVSGIVGFLPLLWCQHPILKDLGLVLVSGMLGIFYSTFFVIPALFKWGEKK